jgi:DNA-binding transcriptional MerR regulator
MCARHFKAAITFHYRLSETKPKPTLGVGKNISGGSIAIRMPAIVKCSKLAQYARKGGVKVEATLKVKDVANELGISVRTLQFWIAEGLLTPEHNKNPERRSRIRFSVKDVREASILNALRAQNLSLQALRESLNYLRSIGHNPMSTGEFLLIKGGNGKPADLLKFCTSGEVLDLLREHRGQFVLPLWTPPIREVEAR